ncbi:Glucose dehydrogenase [FAD, quinone] [Gryllus bimaculatus]|nr:Glucose dehydrogenase [FAD, quinone] [Gryllus bimaculatus]
MNGIGQPSSYVNIKQVIVAGGPVNSPALLLRSGVGPRSHLEELGIPVVKDLPVGYNLQATVWRLRPRSRGRVSLRSADPEDAPLIDPQDRHWDSDEYWRCGAAYGSGRRRSIHPWCTNRMGPGADAGAVVTPLKVRGLLGLPPGATPRHATLVRGHLSMGGYVIGEKAATHQAGLRSGL